MQHRQATAHNHVCRTHHGVKATPEFWVRCVLEKALQTNHRGQDTANQGGEGEGGREAIDEEVSCALPFLDWVGVARGKSSIVRWSFLSTASDGPPASLSSYTQVHPPPCPLVWDTCHMRCAAFQCGTAYKAISTGLDGAFGTCRRWQRVNKILPRRDRVAVDGVGILIAQIPSAVRGAVSCEGRWG